MSCRLSRTFFREFFVAFGRTARAVYTDAMTNAMAATARIARVLTGCGRRAFASVRGDVIHVTNPATGAVVARVSADDDMSVARKFVEASRAQRKWASTPASDRAACLRRYAQSLKDNANDLASEITTEMGKPRTQAKAEVLAAARRVEAIVDIAVSENLAFARDASPGETKADSVRHASRPLEERVELEPVGVVAHISAWNYPHLLAASVAASALVTGNAVLHKPSEKTPASGARVESMLSEAGVPKGVFQTCQGGPSVGASLVALRGLGAIAFTGSAETGANVARGAVRDVAVAGAPKTVLELGGNDAAYVRRDASLDSAAASIASGAFENAGQGCCAVERVYVHRDVAAPFVEKLVDAARIWHSKTGDPADAGVALGPLVDIAAARRVAAQVTEAVDLGAEIVYQGATIPGNHGSQGAYYPVTIVGGAALRGSPRAFALTREETFGPVVAVVVVDDDEEAVESMNDTKYGLTASVFSSDEGIAVSLLRRLRVGTGYVNACNVVSPRLPWGGRGASGFGVSLGKEGILSFLNSKSLYVRE